MLETHLRQVATVVLESAIRISPPDAREWGLAMRGELSHVEGPWAALMWALGGAGILAKHALASLLTPGHSRQAIPSHRSLFAQEGPMRKATFITSVTCAVGALLFFFTPAFRQAFRASLAAWYPVFHVTSNSAWYGQQALKALAKRAEAQHDPEGLAFAAPRLVDAPESARLAEQAVRLDPKLIWLYAVVAVRHPDLPEISQWVAKLERWDPQNALLHMIISESADINIESHIPLSLTHNDLSRTFAEDPARHSALAAAFASSRFDDYLGRLKELDRRVVPRYTFNEPYEVLSGEDYGLPSYSFWDSHWFAGSLLQLGQKLEAGGDRKGAARKYWEVARFGQVMESQEHTDSEHYLGSRLQAQAYKRLQAISEEESNGEEAVLFGYLAGKSEQPHWPGGTSIGRESAGQDVSGWNATVVKVSGLMMVGFGVLLLICALSIIARSRSLRPSALRADRMTAAFGLTGAVGWLLASAALYVTYRPYSVIFDRYIQAGDESHLRELSQFLDSALVLPGAGSFYQEQYFVSYFWLGLTLFGFSALSLMAVRHIVRRRHASALASR